MEKEDIWKPYKELVNTEEYTSSEWGKERNRIESVIKDCLQL